MSDAKIGWRAAPRVLATQLPQLASAFTVVLAIAAALVPLPQGLVDLLLSASLAFAVLVFVAALRAENPLRFLSFPRLLLLVTSFRLVLNVATTRLILGEANAGEVIDAFAGFVTRGDLVVGLVMFGIITAIQYLVIARGTERVAEVGARFALDGMPGRQSAIEADLRSGLLSAAEAGRRRAELDAYSGFHGRMDGAVKFVKADAIVGLIIVAINVVGGLAIGVSRGGLDVAAAFETYGRLAIGDGLLSQIPAVLLSLSAGLLVSRIDEAQLEAREGWLEPAMFLVPAVLLAGVGLVPGMPTFAFLAVALVLLALALVGTARAPAPTQVELSQLELRLPSRLSASRTELERALLGVVAQAEANLGLGLPRVRMAFAGAASTDANMELRRGDHLLLREALPEAGPSTQADALVLPVFRALVSHGEHFVDLSTVERWLEEERRVRPAAARVASERLKGAQILELLRALLREQIPLPQPREIVAAIAENEVFSDPQARSRWSEELRLVLAQTWVRDLVDAQRERGAMTLRATPDLEHAFESLANSTPTATRALVCAKLFSGSEDASAPPHIILVTRPSARPSAAAFVAEHRPRVVVLSQAELKRAGLSFADARWLDDRALDLLD